MMKFLLSAGLLGLAAADSCSEYSHEGFMYAPKLENGVLCGASYCPQVKIGNAADTRTFAKAESVCAEAGMRVPTLEELKAGEAQGTGCVFDHAYVWSSTNAGCGANERKAYSLSSEICTNENGLSDSVYIRCVAANTAAPTPSPTYYQSLAAALAIPSHEAAISYVAGLGSDGSTVYMCSRDSQLCFKNLSGARGTFDLVSNDSEHANATPFEVSANSGDGTWTVTPAGLDFVANAGASYSFPASCSCSGGGA